MEKRKIQKRTIESREKLRAAAWQLFCEKGYYNTNTKEIAKLAGISVGNFYNYYKDKDAIYYELTFEYMLTSNQMLEDMCQEAKNQDTFSPSFEQYAWKQIKRASESNLLFKDFGLIIHDNKELNNTFEEQTERMIQTTEDLICNLPGVKMKASSYVTARLLFTLVDKAFIDIIMVQNKPYFEEYVNELIRVVNAYLFGE